MSAAVEHPEWCDQARCTAEPTSTISGAHRSPPVAFSAGAGANLDAAANLYRSHTRWRLVRTCVEIIFTGLSKDREDAEIAVTLTDHDALQLAHFLQRVGERAKADDVAHMLASLDHEEQS